jgi:SNF2 family DNA or RNA helicase
MSDAEDSFLRGNVVADDCGLRKTILTLFHIYHRYQEQMARYADDGKGLFRPTLIVCPAALIDVWYNEWQQLFNGKLLLI